MVGDANRANLTINAVDAAGLDATVNERNVLSSRGFATTNERDSRISVTEGESTLDRGTKSNVTNYDEALARVAAGTGGVHVRNTNDLARGFRAIENGLRAYYVLSYALSGQLDGSYRAITVKVLRKDVEVRTRSGYYATAAAASTAFEAPILAMLAATGPAPRDLQVAVKTERFRSGAGWDVPVVLSVDASGLTPVRAGAAGGSDYQLDAVVLVRDASGRAVATLSRSALFRVPTERIAEFTSDRVPLVCFAPDQPLAFHLVEGLTDRTDAYSEFARQLDLVGDRRPRLPGTARDALNQHVFDLQVEGPRREPTNYCHGESLRGCRPHGAVLKSNKFLRFSRLGELSAYKTCVVHRMHTGYFRSRLIIYSRAQYSKLTIAWLVELAGPLSTILSRLHFNLRHWRTGSTCATSYVSARRFVTLLIDQTG